MRTLLIIGHDRISARVLEHVRDESDVLVAIDKSTNLGRVLRLLRRGSLSTAMVAKMAICEWRREARTHGRSEAVVRSNRDIAELVNANRVERIVLFRAGLIISRAVLSIGVPVFNVHCARLPEYGGIGSIARALEDGALKQCATLHRVTETIDSGVVVDTEPYELEPARGYCANENAAYEAGIKLLSRHLSRS